MLTADDLLKKIISFKFDETKKLLPSRDIRVIIGLSKAISESSYITENQGRLLLKILSNHEEKIKELHDEISEVLASPSWAKPFRRIEQKKILKIIKDSQGDSFLTIEVFYAGETKEFLLELMRKLSGMQPTTTPGTFKFSLTEKNIVMAVEGLTDKHFEIDSEIVDYYNIIKSWSENEVEHQFFISSMANQNFQTMVSNEIGSIESLSKHIINDRRLRYQYLSEFYQKNPENLTEIVANRTYEHCWVDSKKYQLNEILDVVQNLQRFPLLLVFDNFDQNQCFQNLQKISEILEKNGIFEDIGIYFRLENTEVGKKFNQLIAEKKYNCRLTKQTKIVGIQNGKIPKFLLKNAWAPMSVISLGNILKHSKISVFANNCDLVISYVDTEPMEPVRFKWR